MEGVERDRSWMVKDPILFFILDGVRHAVSSKEDVSWSQARKDVLHYFPDAEIVIPELEDE
jgi:hypothetical protein